MSAVHICRWALLLGLAFVFTYFGIEKFLYPSVWIVWLPSWLDGQLSLSLSQWLQVIAVGEIIIAAALVFPVLIVQRIGAFFAAAYLMAALTQTGWNDVAVRNVGLLMMATGLWYLLKDERVVK